MDIQSDLTEEEFRFIYQVFITQINKGLLDLTEKEKYVFCTLFAKLQDTIKTIDLDYWV